MKSDEKWWKVMKSHEKGWIHHFSSLFITFHHFLFLWLFWIQNIFGFHLFKKMFWFLVKCWKTFLKNKFDNQNTSFWTIYINKRNIWNKFTNKNQSYERYFWNLWYVYLFMFLFFGLERKWKTTYTIMFSNSFEHGFHKTIV